MSFFLLNLKKGNCI